MHPGRRARLRRHRHQRAPQHALQHDPDRQPHGRRDRERDEAAPGSRSPGFADQSPVPEPRGRGVRDARRDVRRAHGVRLPARHRHGVLGQRRHDQPGDRPRPVPRVAGGHREGVDGGRAEALRRGLLHVPLPQPWPSRTRSRGRSASSSAPGSKETVQLAIDYDLGYSIVFVPIPEPAARLRAPARDRRRAGARPSTRTTSSSS